IVERHATGFDTRAYVIEDRLIAAFKRVAAHIEGDGEHTIGQLIDLKNQKRRLNPHLSASQIKIDGKLNDFIGSQGYSLDSVLERHATGFDTRAYVIEDRLIAAFKRVAAHIEGDGEHTIGQLIDLKNQKRRLNPHLSASQIKIDGKLNDFIGSQGYSLDSVLE